MKCNGLVTCCLHDTLNEKLNERKFKHMFSESMDSYSESRVEYIQQENIDVHETKFNDDGKK